MGTSTTKFNTSKSQYPQKLVQLKYPQKQELEAKQGNVLCYELC